MDAAGLGLASIGLASLLAPRSAPVVLCDCPPLGGAFLAGVAVGFALAFAAAGWARPLRAASRGSDSEEAYFDAVEVLAPPAARYRSSR